jgi:hypothetical protein
MPRSNVLPCSARLSWQFASPIETAHCSRAHRPSGKRGAQRLLSRSILSQLSRLSPGPWPCQRQQGAPQAFHWRFVRWSQWHCLLWSHLRHHRLPQGHQNSLARHVCEASSRPRSSRQPRPRLPSFLVAALGGRGCLGERPPAHPLVLGPGCR